MPSAETAHRTVLLHETVDQLINNPDGVYLDATFGRGGHSREILRRLSPAGRLIAIDRDPQAIEAAAQIHDARFVIKHAPFSEFARVLHEQGVAQADGLLFDLGCRRRNSINPSAVSVSALTDLDMRMDTSSGPTVAEYLATAVWMNCNRAEGLWRRTGGCPDCKEDCGSPRCRSAPRAQRRTRRTGCQCRQES
jgi:Predicted S-adenosylmethionine-dependent methyltransferase involved in cell envelope biogenesis